MTRRSPFTVAAFIAITALATASCDSWYYGTMKKFGLEKRDILVKRVTEARKSQEEAKDQFKTAIERFKSVIEVEDGPLEDKYETLNRELNRSEDRAMNVRDRIEDVRSVSDDLFKNGTKTIVPFSSS